MWKPPQKSILFSDPESISEMLKCGGCSNQMEQPKMLPCQHTFCIHCLSNMKNKRYGAKNHIRCEICKKYHQLPLNGEYGFPYNRILLDLQALCQDGSIDIPNGTAFFIRQIL